MVAKDCIWLGSTRRDLTEAPASVRRTMGGALRTAQQGGKSAEADPMKGDLRDVMEVRDSDESSIFRFMYTTKIGDSIYVLDYFQKKGTSGGSTRKEDLERVRQRLKKAREHHAATNRR